MDAALRHPLTRELRITRAISRLTRAFITRRSQGRPTAHLLRRCRILSDAYLRALDHNNPHPANP